MPEEFEDDERGMRDEATGKWTYQPVQTFDKWKAERMAQFQKAGWDVR
jgi:hypothetical protein